MFKLLKIGALMSVVFIQACSFVATPYGMSGENIQLLKSVGDVKVDVDNISSYKPGLNSIGCRAAGSVKTPNGESFEKYIEDAFKSELNTAGIYDENSSIVLSGKLKNVNFNSNIGAGKWVFTLDTISSNNKSITTNTTYTFSTSFVADAACQQVAQSLSPAVQLLIRDVISNPEFQDLLVPVETASK